MLKSIREYLQRRRVRVAALTRSSGMFRDPRWNFCLNESEFANRIEYEINRCQRRPRDAQFGLLILNGAWVDDARQALKLLSTIQQNVRNTDQIGSFREGFAILLPETARDGAFLVMRRIEKIATNLGLSIDQQIEVYPWDDSIGSPTLSLRQFAFDSGVADDDERAGVNGDERPPADGTPCSQWNASTGEKFDPGESRATMTERQQTTLPRLQPHSSRRLPSVGTHWQPGNSLIRPSLKTPLWKRLIDVCGAVVGLVVFSPLLAIAALAIKLESRGPVFFLQMREGKDGKTFRLIKLRTMREGAEAFQESLRASNQQDGPAFKIKHDPRVTRVGKFLRRGCIDELPQLWNVLRGEMSLVGPRPLPLSESTACELWQRRRLVVLPGMTCVWQAAGAPRGDFDQWMRMDLKYVENSSLLLDVTLLWQTLCLVLRLRGSV